MTSRKRTNSAVLPLSMAKLAQPPSHLSKAAKTMNCLPSTHHRPLTKKSRLYLRLRKRPPTRAARWITCVGLCFANSASVAARSLVTEQQYTLARFFFIYLSGRAITKGCEISINRHLCFLTSTAFLHARFQPMKVKDIQCWNKDIT